jgi:hypothetical protein
VDALAEALELVGLPGDEPLTGGQLDAAMRPLRASAALLALRQEVEEFHVRLAQRRVVLWEGLRCRWRTV